MTSISAAIFTSIDYTASNFSFSMAKLLTDDFKILFSSIAALYVVISLTFIMIGHGNGKEVILSIILIALISSALNSNNFYKNSIQTITQTPLKVSGFIIDTAFQNEILIESNEPSQFKMFYALDKMFVRMFDVCNQLTPEISIFNIGLDLIFMFIVLIVIFSLYAVMHVSYLCLIVISTICIHALIAIGGPIIFLSAFKCTRSVFYGWIKAIMSYGLITIFATIMLSFSIKGVHASIGKLELLDNGAEFGEYAISFLHAALWIAIAIVTILKSPDLAAALTGTYPGSTVNITSGLAKTAGLAAGAYMGGAKLAASKVLVPSMTAGIGKAASAGFPGATRAYSALKGINGPATR